MPTTIDEALAALKTEIGDKTATSDEAKALAKKLRDAVPELGKTLLNAGAARARGEEQPKLAAVIAEKDAALAQATELQAEFDAFKARTPDVAAVETKWGEKLKEERAKHRKELEDASGRVVKSLSEAAQSALVAELISSGAEPDYAEFTLVPKYANRIAVAPDGTRKILQLDADLPYDGPNDTARIKALAKDLIKVANPNYVKSNADNGAGTQNGGGGAGTLTETQIYERKQANPIYRGVL